MSFERHVAFWVGFALLIAALLWLFGSILLPFVAGAALAYLLNPATNRLERAGLNRGIAALVLIATVLVVLVVLLLSIVPVVGSQLSGFMQNLPGYIRKVQDLIADPGNTWLSSILGEGFAGAQKSAGELVGQAVAWLATFVTSIWTGGAALISLFSLLVLTPIVAFYFLVDWQRMIDTVDAFVPVRKRGTVRELAHEMDLAIAGFVRGQTLVCLALGLFYAIALSIVGLNFGLLIGLVAGLIGFIPYVGSVTGLVLSLAVALAQFWPDWTWVLVVAGIFFVGQFIEGNILVPKMVGDSAGLHPLWLMFSLFAFGYLFGFVGLLLAVPLAAAIGVLIRFAAGRYRESTLFTGER